MRYIQITQNRSGTHMIAGLLFPQPHMNVWHGWNLQLSKKPERLADFIEREHAKHPPGTFVGCMTHFGEMRAPGRNNPWQHSWTRLRNLHDKCIVLIRNNTLRRYLSIQIAKSTGKWHCNTPRESQPTVQLNLQAYLRHTELHTWTYTQVMEWIHPYLFLTYEDLVSDWERSTKMVYDYLDLEWDNPKPPVYQQEHRLVKDIISNWDQVMNRALRLPPSSVTTKLLKELNS